MEIFSIFIFVYFVGLYISNINVHNVFYANFFYEFWIINQPDKIYFVVVIWRIWFLKNVAKKLKSADFILPKKITITKWFLGNFHFLESMFSCSLTYSRLFSRLVFYETKMARKLIFFIWLGFCNYCSVCPGLLLRVLCFSRRSTTFRVNFI